jgi:hypothetical protein
MYGGLRQAYDLTTEGFGAGFNGALLIVAQDVRSPAAASQIAGALTRLPDVATVTPVTAQNGVSPIKVIPKSWSNDPATVTPVNTVRGDRAAIEGGTGAHILVGGPTRPTLTSRLSCPARCRSSLSWWSARPGQRAATPPGGQRRDPPDSRSRGHRHRIRVPGNYSRRRAVRAARHLRAPRPQRRDRRLPRLPRPSRLGPG